MSKFFKTLVAGALIATACAAVVHAKERTLHERLGGKQAIAAVADEFVGRVAGDTRINAFFAATAANQQRLAGFKAKLVDQICRPAGYRANTPART